MLTRRNMLLCSAAAIALPLFVPTPLPVDRALANAAIYEFGGGERLTRVESFRLLMEDEYDSFLQLFNDPTDRDHEHWPVACDIARQMITEGIA